MFQTLHLVPVVFSGIWLKQVENWKHCENVESEVLENVIQPFKDA
jgi:hypothetical protein